MWHLGRISPCRLGPFGKLLRCFRAATKTSGWGLSLFGMVSRLRGVRGGPADARRSAGRWLERAGFLEVEEG